MIDQDLYRRNFEAIEEALLSYGLRKVLSQETGIHESQLSKLLGGTLTELCKILAALHLQVSEASLVPTDPRYLDSIRIVLREELKRHDQAVCSR